MRMRKQSVLIGMVCVVLASTGVSALGQTYVWWEGEDFEDTNVPDPVNKRTPGNRTPEQREKLSGGAWMTPSGPVSDTPYFITYNVDVPEAGTYGFWVRKFWKHGPFKWRFGDGEWQTCGRDIALHDSTYLEKNWGANWVVLGEAALKAGSHKLQIEMLEEKGGGCFDCFLLIQGQFMPRGKLKPGEASGKAEEGCFAWEPPADPLRDDCPIDLRYLNEAQAGMNGFVKRDGDHFVLGNGQPVRFWMVQAELRSMDNRSIDRWARRLAKYGVNLVRMGHMSFFQSYVKGDKEAFAKDLERLHYVVSALKKEGIYAYLGHLFWHSSDSCKITEDVFPGFGKGKQALALLFFSEQFQDYYKEYVRAIMAPQNPYTGVPLKEEPAIAFVEVQNESSLLFWNFKPKAMPQTELDLVEKHFGDWLAARYGSIGEAANAWGQDKGPHTPDRFAEGRVGIYDAGTLTGADWAVGSRNAKRATDQTQWMVESMRRFYADMKRDLATEVGLKQMISASNWKTADSKILGGLERHTYAVTDVICRNSYFGVDYAKDGQQKFYAIEEGDTYRYQSALKPPARPGALATPLIADHTFMITENNWTRPNRFRAEWPFMIATYAQMMGVDGWNFFALGSAEWQHQMAVWDINNPSILGQFPAAALVFRRGDVTEPKSPAVHEEVSIDEAYALKGTQIYALSGKDDLWVSRIGAKEGADTGTFGVDPRAFFVGPVVQEFVKGPSRLETVDLTRYINEEKQTVESLTGELSWNYGSGLITLQTPRAQGACGFLKEAGPITLGDVVIRSDNEYGTVLVVSLDGKPLAESSRVLIQVGTADHPYGFKTRQVGEYERITNLGGYPLNVEKVHASVTLKTAAGKTAVVLDGNGYRTDKRADATPGAAGLAIRLPEDALYTLVE